MSKLTLQEQERPVWRGFYARAIEKGLVPVHAAEAADVLILECRKVAQELWPEQTMN